MLDKILYNTILSQAFSPCGKYLVAGNIYGQIAIFDLEIIRNPVIELLNTNYNRPKYLHQLQDDTPICSLISLDKFLIVGTVSEISGWSWKTLLNTKLSKPTWTIKIQPKKLFEQCDINSLWCSEEGKLYAGCGDNNIYVYDLEDGSLVSSYEGHTDFIHSVHGQSITISGDPVSGQDVWTLFLIHIFPWQPICSGSHFGHIISTLYYERMELIQFYNQNLVSAGEDGLVLLWDMRMKQPYNQLEPSNNSKLVRPDIGKWIGSAAIGDDWIVCGGGPKLSLWNLRSLDAVTVFDTPDHGIHISFFHDDCVVAGGTAKYVYQLSYSGDVRVELPTSSTTVYSVGLRTNPDKILAIAGSSPEIDICTSFNYRDQVLHFR